MGLAREEAGFMSADMVELAGDLASFNNVDATQVLEAMKSSLAGSSERATVWCTPGRGR